MKKLILILPLMMLWACGPMIKEAPAGPMAVDAAYDVQLGHTWAELPPQMAGQNEGKLLTVDGQQLNQQQMFGSIEDGEALLITAKKAEITPPTYRSDMSEMEVIEFVTDTLAKSGMQNISVEGMRPAPFGSLDGIRFDIKGSSNVGLNLSGTVAFAKEGGKLHLITFLAPSQHYFGRHKAEVESIMRSIKLHSAAAQPIS